MCSALVLCVFCSHLILYFFLLEYKNGSIVHLHTHTHLLLLSQHHHLISSSLSLLSLHIQTFFPFTFPWVGSTIDRLLLLCLRAAFARYAAQLHLLVRLLMIFYPSSSVHFSSAVSSKGKH